MAAPLQTVFRSVCRNHAVRSVVQRSAAQIIAPCFTGVQLTQVRFKGKGRYKVASESVSSREQRIKRPRRAQEAQQIIDKEADPELMARVPSDDVWIRAYYPDPRLSFLDAVHQLRQFACPEMTDNLKGILRLQLTLNISTKKKTKFMGTFSKTMLLPHKFGKEVEKRVVAFCKTPEDAQKARDARAAYVGGLDLMRAIENGEIHHEDYDVVVCTMDMIDDLTPLKKLLKDLFPHNKRGNLGYDIEELVTMFVEGKTFESTRDEDNVGHLTLDVGTLSLTDDQLMDNFKAYMQILNNHRKPPSGPFITKAHLTCAPSGDKVILSASETLIEKKLEPSEDEQLDKEEDEEAVAA